MVGSLTETPGRGRAGEASEDRRPRYSVIVPAYNSAPTIEACLRALLDQSVPRESYEVIVVDDGSTDNTPTLAASFPVVVLRQEHAGPASARNRAAEEAAGQFLLFTDADCVPVRNWIEELVRPLEADEEIVAAKGAYRTEQRSLIARFAQVELEVKYAAMRRKAQIDFVDTASAVFRRDAFWEGGAFDPGFSEASNEDTQLSFNLASRGRKLVFAEKGIVYHRHSESLRYYLLRKWRHGYWRIRVYREHPEKIAGDSYTPRSTQLQLLMVALTLVLGILPWFRLYALGTALLFVLGTLPFVRRALPVGPGVALAAPAILFLRALALGSGLAAGTVALALGGQMRTRGGEQQGVQSSAGRR